MPDHEDTLRESVNALRSDVAVLMSVLTDMRATLARHESAYATRETVATLQRDLAGKASAEALADTTKDVADLANFRDWVVKIVMGLVIVALVGLVVAGPTSAFGR